jgi:hypothetical protein
MRMNGLPSHGLCGGRWTRVLEEKRGSVSTCYACPALELHAQRRLVPPCSRLGQVSGTYWGPTGGSRAAAISRQAPGPVIESRSADSIVDVVWIDPRSIPSSAMVCAMAGEIPEMMVLQPINTAAFAILIK